MTDSERIRKLEEYMQRRTWEHDHKHYDCPHSCEGCIADAILKILNANGDDGE